MLYLCIDTFTVTFNRKDLLVDIDDTEALNQPRTDRVTVMKNVCADLEFAAANCRYTTDNTINNMCANALLSRVALFEAAWQKYHANNSAEAAYFYGVAKKAAVQLSVQANTQFITTISQITFQKI